MNSNRGNKPWQRRLDELLAGLEAEGRVPSLLLHACCAPCSSYCLEYLARYFHITVFYYNPNIYPDREYEIRVREEQRFIAQGNADGLWPHEVRFVEGSYLPQRFEAMARGLEDAPEGGARCRACYELRMREAALLAKEGGYDWFCTTLSISPHKNAAWINEIGYALQEELGIAWLPSDFKKKGGFLRSTELSRAYGFYRQNYCGCRFSIRTGAGDAAAPAE